MSAAISWAASKLLAVPCLGAGRPASASTRPNAPRSSARWIAAGLVPTIGTPAASRRAASPSGVWPPSRTITPASSPEAERVPHLADDVRGDAPDRADLLVAEAVPLGLAQHVDGQARRRRDGARDLVEQDDLVEEPGVDPGRRMQLLDGGPAAERPLY